MTKKSETQKLRETIETLGEEKFKWMQIARDYKLRMMRAEKKNGHLIREIEELRAGLSQLQDSRETRL